MNTETHTPSSHSKLPSAKSAVSSVKSSVESKIPSIAGISLPEIAILGAAGFVLWKNRSKIQSLLEQNGIAVPTILSGDFSELLQKGATAMGGQGKENHRKQSTSQGSESVRKHDA
jgi:hypothetical protein